METKFRAQSPAPWESAIIALRIGRAFEKLVKDGAKKIPTLSTTEVSQGYDL
jgi:hypothetical protein